MQVYKYMNIGSAKPSRQELDSIPHHLVDIRLPSQQFNAGDFIKEAERAVEEIRQRNKIPVISGGTAFYLKSFLYGLPDVPEGNNTIRERLNKEACETGGKSLYERLKKIDPEHAAKVDPANLVRVIRALEVFEITGKPLSSFKPPKEPRKDIAALLIGLNRERAELYDRINRRVTQMFDRGLTVEIKGLITRGYTEEDPGMKGIGYSEFFRMLRTSITLKQVEELIQQNSRRYAKRQLTFFKAFEGVKWFHPREKDNIKEEIEKFLAPRLTEEAKKLLN